jgi:hypothetical protein
MNAKTIGIIIMIIGLVMTLYTGFNYVTREKVVDIGKIEITADKDNAVSWVHLLV